MLGFVILSEFLLFVLAVQYVWLQIALIALFIFTTVLESGIFSTSWILGSHLLILGLLGSIMIYIKELFKRIFFLLNFNESKLRERYKNILSTDLPNALIVLENNEEMTL